MVQHNLISYQLEIMQPSWLETNKQIRSYIWVLGLLAGLRVELVGRLVVGLFSELREKKLEDIAYPGQRLKLTRNNAVFVTFLFGLVFVPVLVLLNELVVGLFFGLGALIQHYTLRAVLVRYGFFPWRLIPFLEYATDLILLHRVGGSYIFIHRTLMEHFAEMELERIESSE